MDRDEQILRHVGRYQVSIRAVIERLFFDGASSDHVLQRLVKDGRLRVVKNAIPGGLSYYQLALSEARALGFSDHRARHDHSKNLRRSILVLWFSCMSGKTRKRLDSGELAHLGTSQALQAPHVAELAGDESAIYRLYLPDAGSKDGSFLTTLRTDIEQLANHAGLSEWVRRRTYGLAVVVENPERAERLEAELRKRSEAHAAAVLIRFEAVPPFDLLHQQITR